MSLLNRVLGALARAVTSAPARPVAQKRPERPVPPERPERPVPSAPRTAGTSRTALAGPTAPGRDVEVYDVSVRGLPAFAYSPDPDGQADPGEVVWTWVPYEDDPSRGKDRPVLVLSRLPEGLVVAQMTSKDHDRDAAQEARWGRYWHDVGTGAWDSRGRRSEVRLDRLLLVAPDAVRREGATMGRTTFEGVVSALRTHWS